MDKKHDVKWSTDGIPYTGTPFMIVNQKVFDCQRGKDRNIQLKEKKKMERIERMVNIDYAKGLKPEK